MIEVEMTKDIRDYETKMFGVLTLRQLVLLIIGIAYSAPIAFLLPIDEIMNKLLIMALLMSPVILMGWITVYGMRLETFVLQIIRSTLLVPVNRKYKIESSVSYLLPEKEKKAKDKKKIQKSAEYPAHK